MIPANFTVVDEVAPFEVFSKNGYYTVGNKIFNFKFNALVESTRTGTEVKWHFHEDIFSKMSWRSRDSLGLDQLYKIRAQQIRDKYDYVVLAFSGGGDSHQILKSFINNNIKLDELIIDWSLKHVDRILNVNDSTDPSNYYSEWALCIKPTLEWVRIKCPDIKITLVDSTEVLSAEDFEDTPTVLNSLTTYQSVKRYRVFKKRIAQLNDKYQNVTTIFGIDKPSTLIEHNALIVKYRDDATWLKTSYNNNLKFNIEYFYWTPDLPEIVKEQCHVIYQYIRFKPELNYLFTPNPVSVYADSNLNADFRKQNRLKRDLINMLVYPDWDGTLFQSNKPDSPHNNSQHSWILSKGTPVELESWFSALNHMRSQLDEKFFRYFEGTTIPIEYKMYVSKAYPIGMLNR
jgi:hypothetical protein